MAIIVAYDALGKGLSMPDTGYAYLPYQSQTAVGSPLISQYDYNTINIMQVYDTAQSNRYVLSLFLTDYSSQQYILESIFYYNDKLNPLIDYYGINVLIDSNSNFSGGAYLSNFLSGNDVISGNSYSDYLKGGAGNDAISGNGGDDIIQGGLGSDYIDGGAGEDAVDYSNASSSVSVNISSGSAQGGGGSDSFVNIEDAIGSAYGDNIIGSDADNLLWGMSGDDYIYGGLGYDTAVFSGSSSQYSISYNRANGEFTFSGVDGVDRLVGVEKFLFQDSVIYYNTYTETTPPTVSSFSPVDGEISASVDGNIVLSFSESVVFGSGVITLRSVSSSGAIVESFDVAASVRISLSGTNLTIDPTNSLSANTHYFLVVPAGALKDIAGNVYAGTATYDFTTAGGNNPLTGTVSITGATTQNQVLTASNTLADADGLGTISYQWKADGTLIAGATGSTLTLAEAQVGKTITVTASYTDGHGTVEAITSTATSVVANVNDAPMGAVAITGTAAQNQVLTASNTLADADGLGTISYQWKANGTPIAGATGNTLTLAEAQVGKVITVTASYTDGHGTVENATSTATASVANVNDAPVAPVTIPVQTASIGRAFSLDLHSYFTDPDSGDASGLTFSITSGALPSGLTLSNGVISGTVSSAAAVRSVTVSAIDSGGLHVEQSFNLSGVATPRAAGLVKYFVSGTAANFVDFSLGYADAGVSLWGSQAVFTGGSGVETVYVAPGMGFDFTKASGGTDRIYLNALLSDYTLGYQGTTLLLTEKASGAVVKVAAGSALSFDQVVFRDGMASSKSLYDAAKASTAPSALDTTVHTPSNPADLHAGLGTLSANTIKAFATSSEGSTFATVPKSGDAMVITGGAGVDIVYVAAYSNVDATKLSGGVDEIYLTGRLSDYSLSYVGTTLVLTRTNGTDTETVKVAGGSALAYDKVVFADGFAKSFDLFNATKNHLSLPTLDTSLITPGQAPTLHASALDGVTNLDVRSNIVLEFSEAVTAVAGKFIHIVNDANSGTKLGYAGENTTNSFVLDVTDPHVTISGSKVTIDPGYDLDLSNNYHIEIDAGAFVGATSHQASLGVSDATTLNFSTVTPDADKSITSTTGLSQIMQADGTMADSLIWKDIEGWPGGKTGSESTLDMSGHKIALVMADLLATVSQYDANNSSLTATNVETGNFNLALQNFGADDLLYMDDLGRNNENVTQTTDLIFGVQVTSDGTSTNFNFDPASGKDGGNIDVLNQAFSTPAGWQQLIHASSGAFVFG